VSALLVSVVLVSNAEAKPKEDPTCGDGDSLYKVRSGQSLSLIAATCAGVSLKKVTQASIDTLAENSQIPDPDSVSSGQGICVPTPCLATLSGLAKQAADAKKKESTGTGSGKQGDGGADAKGKESGQTNAPPPPAAAPTESRHEAAPGGDGGTDAAGDLDSGAATHTGSGVGPDGGGPAGTNNPPPPSPKPVDVNPGGGGHPPPDPGGKSMFESLGELFERSSGMGSVLIVMAALLCVFLLIVVTLVVVRTLFSGTGKERGSSTESDWTGSRKRGGAREGNVKGYRDDEHSRDSRRRTAGGKKTESDKRTGRDDEPDSDDDWPRRSGHRGEREHGDHGDRKTPDDKRRDPPRWGDGKRRKREQTRHADHRPEDRPGKPATKRVDIEDILAAGAKRDLWFSQLPAGAERTRVGASSFDEVCRQLLSILIAVDDVRERTGLDALSWVDCDPTNAIPGIDGTPARIKLPESLVHDEASWAMAMNKLDLSTQLTRPEEAQTAALLKLAAHLLGADIHASSLNKIQEKIRETPSEHQPILMKLFRELKKDGADLDNLTLATSRVEFRRDADGFVEVEVRSERDPSLFYLSRTEVPPKVLDSASLVSTEAPGYWFEPLPDDPDQVVHLAVWYQDRGPAGPQLVRQKAMARER